MTSRTLEQEQEAFEAQLDALRRDHEGRVVLFHGGHPVAFFDDEVAAYQEGISKFGPDGVFLIAKVEEPDTKPISVAWDYGVMFGTTRIA